MKKSNLFFAFVATLLLATSAMAQYTPAETFYAAGSSAQFNTFALAAGYPIYSGGALCGNHRWTQKTSSANPITLNDPRSSSILPEPGNIWIVWNDAAANHTSGGVVCFFVVVDSIVGVRSYQARATVSLPAGLVGVADAGIVPLLGFSGPGGTAETLPANIQSIVNGAVINVGITDIRPEDAKFATMRALTAYGTQVTGRSATGVGYGPFPLGTTIQSSQSGGIANPVDFAIDPGDTDPINSSVPVRHYAESGTGAAPVMVFANQQNTGSGHFGDGNYTNINRFVLANVLSGNESHIRAIATVAGEADAGIHVFIREPLSGTYSTMEWCVPNSREVSGDPSWGVGAVSGQESNINPSNNSCTTKPCTVESGNPLWHIFANGGTRGRVVGSGDMVTAVNNTADGFGYSFWNFSSYQGKSHIKYLTVDGVDPLYSGPNDNPNGVGVFPQCTVNGSGQVTSCPQLTFPNIVNGTYPIWSKYRLMYDPTDSTNIATAVVAYAQEAANPGGGNPGSGILTDFLPATKLQVFRSHYAQVVRDNGIAYGPNNGLKSGVPETGGDAGGAVFTVQSELDFIADTGGNQQVNFKQ